jgi:hypothetical protein
VPHGEGRNLTTDIFQLGFRREAISEEVRGVYSSSFQVLRDGLPITTANEEFQRTAMHGGL